MNRGGEDQVELTPLLSQSLKSLPPPPPPPPPPLPPTSPAKQTRSVKASKTMGPASPITRAGRPQLCAITADPIEEAKSARPTFSSLNQRSDSVDAADVAFSIPSRPSLSNGGRLAVDYWQQQILDAAKAKLFDKVVALTKVPPASTSGRKLLASPASGRTAAHFAAADYCGAFALKALLETFGAECLLQDDNNCCTPILNACKSHCSQIVTDLVEAALTIDGECLARMQDRDGDTCFHIAARRRDGGAMITELVKLVECSGRLLVSQNCSHQTPLHIACEEQPAATALALVNLAADAHSQCLADLRDQNGDTCLHVAARKRDKVALIAKLLKVKGFNERCLLQTNNWKQTPLHIACDKQDAITALKLIRLALQVDSNCLEMADHNLDTFFHIATRKRDNGMLITELVKMATSREKGLLLENIWKQTPLHIACEFQDIQTAIKLVELAQEANQHCLTQMCDKKNNTCFHMAAKRWHDGQLIVELISRAEFKERSLLQKNDWKQTPMHIACRHQNAETVLELLFMALNAGISKDFLQLMQEHNGDTCYHIAARKRDDGVMITELIKMADNKEKCILLENDNQRTPLHIVCEVQKPEVCMKLLDIACKVNTSPNLADSNGNSCLHYLAKNKGLSSAEWAKILNAFGHEGLQLRNGFKQTPLHFLLEHQCWPIVERSLALTPRNSLKVTDEAGNTCLHYAARGFQETFTRATALCGLDSLKWLNKDRETPLQLALRHVPLPKKFDQRNKLYDFLVEHSDRIAFRHANLSQGTLLHSLFMPPDNHFYADHNATLFHIRFIKLLCLSGVDPSRENNVHENFLHCSTLPTAFLAKILKYSSTESEIGEIFRHVLVNSQGLHAAHTFSRRYDLKRILEPLAELSEMSPEDLVRLPVSKGPYAGATCLHFACEAGHKENIGFLLDRGLSLSYETHSGLSCIDFGFDKGRLDVITEVATAAGVSQIDLLRLIDPPKSGLKLPDLETARKALALIADASVLAEAEKDRSAQRQDDVGAGAGFSKESKALGADISILCKAFEHDSPVILRCAIRLWLLNLQAEKDFLSMFNSTAEDAKSKQDVEDGVRIANDKRRFSFSGSFNCSSEVEQANLTMSDVAALHERVNILPDLIIIRQFDIIPCAVNAIIQLKSKVVAMEGKHDQLSKLRKRIITIAATCLDDLYLNGFVEDKQLLYNYIRGDIDFESKLETDNKSRNNSTKGPKFPSRSTLDGTSSYKTVMKLMEESDCDELFATECMHHLVCSDWKTPECDAVLPKLKLSARLRFYFYFLSFIVFLCVFAYHIIGFRLPSTAQQFPAKESALLLIIGLYALSFTCHEIDDFYRRRRRRMAVALGRSLWCPQYFKDSLNYFDILAILAMWIGISLNLTAILHVEWRDRICHLSQIVLSTSFLLWGFRSAAFLYYYHKIGPVISILGSLIIKDLLPFLLLIFVIFYSFGVFFFNLLFPFAGAQSDERGFSDVAAQIFTMPFYMMFGIFEKFDFQTANSSEANSSDIRIGELAHPRGHWWFYNILIFAFLILVDIVMVNLLIALFSLTVNRMADKALVIWRRKYYDMLQEYRHISFLPPPISFLYYLAKWLFACPRRDAASRLADSQNVQPWWSCDGPQMPEDYKKFLNLQAQRFRVSRPKLLHAVSQNHGELQELMGHTEQLLQMQSESESALGRQAEMLELMHESLDDRIQEIKFESQRQIMKLQGEIKTKTEQLQQAVQQLAAAQNSLRQELQTLREEQAELLGRLEANQTQQMKQLICAINQLTGSQQVQSSSHS